MCEVNYVITIENIASLKQAFTKQFENATYSIPCYYYHGLPNDVQLGALPPLNTLSLTVGIICIVLVIGLQSYIFYSEDE